MRRLHSSGSRAWDRGPPAGQWHLLSGRPYPPSLSLLPARPCADGDVPAAAALMHIRPANILLKFDWQGVDRPLRQVAGAGLTIFMSEAADRRQDRHGTFLS